MAAMRIYFDTLYNTSLMENGGLEKEDLERTIVGKCRTKFGKKLEGGKWRNGECRTTANEWL